MTDIEMMEVLELAKLESMGPNPYPVYALSNGNRITFVRKYNYETMKRYFEKSGYWVCSIFENGHRVEA